jgi:hypothetical protein
MTFGDVLQFLGYLLAGAGVALIAAACVWWAMDRGR